MTAKKPRKKIQPAGRKRRFTKDQVETAIIKSGGCKIAAARALGCSRMTLDSYIPSAGTQSWERSTGILLTRTSTRSSRLCSKKQRPGIFLRPFLFYALRDGIVVM